MDAAADRPHNADRSRDQASLRGVERAMHIIRVMANEGGCAWHEAQTHESLTPFLIEEAAEFIDAIERHEAASEVQNELGDVLYQVLFHAAIAERDGEGYDLEAVAEALSDKLVARHPHVFGDREYMTVEELNAEWERLKEDAAGETRGSRDALEGIPSGMPTLARTAKIIERLKRAKLINPSAGELRPDDPLASAVGSEEARIAEVGIGDAMLAIVLRANAAGVDADRALRLATNRLTERVLAAE